MHEVTSRPGAGAVVRTVPTGDRDGRTHLKPVHGKFGAVRASGEYATSGSRHCSPGANRDAHTKHAQNHKRVLKVKNSPEGWFLLVDKL